MRRITVPIVAALFAILAISCGSDSSTSPSGPTQSQGGVTKGPVIGATVNVYAVGTFGPGDLVAGPFTTDSVGQWDGEIPSGISGPFIICATGGSYADEASGETINLGSSTFYSISTSGNGQLTPISQAMYEFALAGTAADGPLMSGWESAVAAFSAAFGFDPSQLSPDAAGSASAQEYLALLGGISELIDSNAALQGLTGVSIPDLILALAQDLADGVLDGLNAIGQIIQVSGTGGPLTFPSLDPVGIGALIDAANAFADSWPGLEGVDLPDIVIDFDGINVGDGSGSLNFSGEGASVIPVQTFSPEQFLSNDPALGWNSVTNQVAIGVGVTKDFNDPTRAISVSVSVAGSQLAYNWVAISFDGPIPGVVISGNRVTIEGLTLNPTLQTEAGTLIVNGFLDE